MQYTERAALESRRVFAQGVAMATGLNGNATTYTYDDLHQMLTAVDPETGEGLDDLTAAIEASLESVLAEPREPAELRLDFSDGRRRAWLHQAGVVEAERQTEDGFILQVMWTERQRMTYQTL